MFFLVDFFNDFKAISPDESLVCCVKCLLCGMAYRTITYCLTQFHVAFPIGNLTVSIAVVDYLAALTPH